MDNDKITDNTKVKRFSAPEALALVVDDNAASRLIACNLLRVYSIRSETADCGRTAIEMAKEKKYDIIFIDHLMPDMDGVETLKHIRELNTHNKTCPIITLSGDLSDENALLFEHAGASGMLNKPIVTEELESILKRFLDKGGQNVNFLIEESDSAEYNNIENKIQENEKVLIRQCLEVIEGIDYDTGLRYNAENEKNYIQTAKVSCTSISEFLEDIKNYVENSDKTNTNESEFEVIKRAFHSLKSIYASLGFIKASEFAQNLETAANNNNKAFIDSNIKEFRKVSERLLRQLKLAVASYDSICSRKDDNESDNEKTVYDTIDVYFYMEEAKNTLRYFEIYGLRDNLKMLSEHAPYELRDKFKKALELSEVFDYDEIEKILNSIEINNVNEAENVEYDKDKGAAFDEYLLI